MDGFSSKSKPRLLEVAAWLAAAAAARRHTSGGRCQTWAWSPGAPRPPPWPQDALLSNTEPLDRRGCGRCCYRCGSGLYIWNKVLKHSGSEIGAE